MVRLELIIAEHGRIVGERRRLIGDGLSRLRRERLR